MEIYWLSNRGKVSLYFNPVRLSWIFLILWSLQLGFTSVFLWLVGACNYLWSAVLLTGFLIPYMRKWHERKEDREDHVFATIIMFVFGIAAGWTNENTGCFTILFVLWMLFKNRKSGCQTMQWEWMGLAGLVIGYLFLMGSPGNFVRLSEDVEHGSYSMDWIRNIYNNGVVFLVVMVFQLPLWVYLWKVMETARKHIGQKDISFEIAVVNGLI